MKKINRLIKISIAVILLSSCSNNKLKGKIETRTAKSNCNSEVNATMTPTPAPAPASSASLDNSLETTEVKLDKVIYLVNTSIDNTYEFTIKETVKVNGKIEDFNTFQKKLAPGDEIYLGCKEYLKGPKFYTKSIVDTIYYWDEKTKTYGGIARIEPKTVTDSARPKEQSKIENIYECTGQRLIKNDKKEQ